MTEFGPFEDPVDALLETDGPHDLGNECAALALRFASVVFPPAAFVSILADQFNERKRHRRVLEYLTQLLVRVKAVEQKSLSVDVMAEVLKRFESKTFSEGVAIGGEEAARAVKPDKGAQFASVAVGWLVPNQWGEYDVATMIRDIAQLTDSDVRVLGILSEIYGSYVNTDPNSNAVAVFTMHMDKQFAAMLASNIQSDDFLSSCARLGGFGLALEESRTPGELRIAVRCFRPTRRGMALLQYLDT
jgi:hypothetical protein